ncbi:TonB-dependent receptor [Sphingorhabdus sp. EL138]|uniref:TonB-dependent receptor n=1 Tax=Sphingorhabdus sp. EL138 TaxID=2073156 RepID=UPI0025D1FF50|nr:TonB-dependent receptor [Sphingorhabdus sp. EL138]
MRRPYIALALSILSASTAMPVYAQTAEADDKAFEGEIIVTAQKREERLVDVPVTLSALSGTRLRELGVSDLDELANYIPGLNIQEQSANNPGVVIRGITSDSGSAQQAARVTLYYNGVDISRSRGSYQDVYDVERIEVIKGPQATLFGTASAVGAISIISARPEAGFSGELTGGIGNFNQRQLGGFVNVGSDTLAGRVAFAFKKRDGYVNNLAPNQDDLNGQDQFGARGSLRFTPNDALTADLILTYDRQRNPGTAFVSKALPTASGPGNPFGDAYLGGSPNSLKDLYADKLGLTRDVYDASFTVNYGFADNWALTMVNGYRKFDSLEVFDADGSAAPYLEFTELAEGNQFNHETRFAYTDDKFRGSFGFNFFHEDSIQNVPFSGNERVFLACLTSTATTRANCVAPNGTVPALALTPVPYSSVFENQGRNDSYSMFADGTWIPTPSLELTAGARVLIEKRRSGFFARVPRSVLTGGASLVPGQIDTAGQTFRTEDSFQAVLPRFNLLYRFSDDFNGYATVSKGRRSATVQLGARSTTAGPVANFTPVLAENIWNYEVGLKGALGIFSGSIGAYYLTYDNFQVSVILPNGTTQTQSAGSATNKGVEAELTMKPTSWLSVFGNIGYIDGGIDDKPTIAANFRGAKFRLQPEVQASGGFTIDADLGGMTFFATPSVTYRSQMFFEVPNNPLIAQAGVTLVNVNAGFRFGEDRFEISAFARNLLDEDYLLDAGNTGGAFGIPSYIAAEPRLYGIKVGMKF